MWTFHSTGTCNTEETNLDVLAMQRKYCGTGIWDLNLFFSLPHFTRLSRSLTTAIASWFDTCIKASMVIYVTPMRQLAMSTLSLSSRVVEGSCLPAECQGMELCWSTEDLLFSDTWAGVMHA